MRKAQFGYGWDWGPRLPTIGIWRPVELRRERRRRSAACTSTRSRSARDGARRGARRGRALRRRGRADAGVELRSPGDGEHDARDRSTLRDGAGCDRLPRASTTRPVVDARPRRAALLRPARHAPTATRRSTLDSRSASARSSSTSRPTPTSRARASSASSSTACRSSPRAPTGSPATRSSARSPPSATRLLGRRPRREHEHAARLGRRHLRARRVLRRVRPARAAGLAGLHVRLRDVPGGRPASSRRSSRGALPGRAGCAATRRLALWCGNNENQWLHDAQLLGPGRAACLRRALLRRRPAARRGRAGRAHALLARLAVRRQRPQQHATTATSTTGTSGTASPRAASASRAAHDHARGVAFLRYAEDRAASSASSACTPRPSSRRCGADPRGAALPPQPGDGLAQQGQPKDKGDHAAAVGHRACRTTWTSTSTSARWPRPRG